MITSLNSLAAAIYFAIAGAVGWKFALIMLAGTLTGGFLGARLVRVVPRVIMRPALPEKPLHMVPRPTRPPSST